MTNYNLNSFDWTNSYQNVFTSDGYGAKYRAYILDAYAKAMASKEIVVSEEDKVKLINKLKENRAFNGDSAYSPLIIEEVKKYKVMVASNLVKTINKKSFWLEENEQ